jgi:hypothetical protein
VQHPNYLFYRDNPCVAVYGTEVGRSPSPAAFGVDFEFDFDQDLGDLPLPHERDARAYISSVCGVAAQQSYGMGKKINHRFQRFRGTARASREIQDQRFSAHAADSAA